MLSAPYSKTTVLDCLKPLTLSVIGNNRRMFETSFLLFANARGTGKLLTAKCPPTGTHRAINARGLPGGGMLAAGFDSHIRKERAISPRVASAIVVIYFVYMPLGFIAT